MKRIVALSVVAAALCVGAAPAQANLLFEVNNAGDRPDDDPNGICDVAPNVGGDQCSLRGAIQETNAIPGSDGIRFAIPGPGVHRITPDSPLPLITGPVEIDGYSQPGATPNTNDLSHPDNAVLKIELSGEDILGNPRGLEVAMGGQGTAIKGLIINGFYTAIRLYDGATVQGNFLGTNPSGTAAVSNRGWGLFIESAQSVTVGGGSPAERNVISGNLLDGISLEPSDGGTVQGNLIGAGADGSQLGNGESGIATVGNQHAINHVTGNVVAFNKRKGIAVADTGLAATSIHRNRVFGNRGLGIDLNDDGITPNDPTDADTGPNELQNFPLLVKAVSGPKATTVQGALASTPNETFTIEYFASPKGSGREGKRFIGQRVVSSDEDGFANFGFRPARRVPIGQAITATATNSNGSTSEFSAPRVVKQP